MPEGGHFTIEIIHDMAGYDCRAYANDFRAVLKEIGWSISRSAVTQARLGGEVWSRSSCAKQDILSRPETVMLNALAAAGIDYDLVRIPDLDADIGLIVNPAPGDSVLAHGPEGLSTLKPTYTPHDTANSSTGHKPA